jgi:anthranilate phosphoribosyltransferase
LPVLTPLLALLLAREGWPVLVHGTATESKRVFTAQVFAALGHAPQTTIQAIAPGSVAFVPTKLLCEGLQRLLDVRRVVNLRNSGHSLVKLMNPCEGKSFLVSSYTHPEYADSMAATFELMGSNALLLRGTEGESVADPRRTPKMQAFIQGVPVTLQEPQTGTLTELPELPSAIDAETTASFIRDVLEGKQAIPSPIAQQVAHIVQLAGSL